MVNEAFRGHALPQPGTLEGAVIALPAGCAAELALVGRVVGQRYGAPEAQPFAKPALALLVVDQHAASLVAVELGPLYGFAANATLLRRA